MWKQIVKNQGAKIRDSSHAIKTLRSAPKKFQFSDIRNLDPTIYLKHGTGFVRYFFQIIHHQGANKYLSNDAVVENYGISLVMVKEYHNTLKSSCDLLCKLPPSPRVWLNCHDIVDVLVYIGGRYAVASYVLFRDFSDIFDIALHCDASLP